MRRGRRLASGPRAVYDVDARLPGESRAPQLEVTLITKYAPNPDLVLGRQIAVNRSYICYGLKSGAIRVLNISSALKALLRGHIKRVTDMAFFAEVVPVLASASVDGRIFVWKIIEGPHHENKPQITEKVVIAIQIVGDVESYHPRVCWHPHKQEVLVVGIGNQVLKIDTTKVRKCEEISVEEPLRCPIEKLIDGVVLIGKHDGEITDLSMSQWMTTCLVSASKDGMVKIWDDLKSTPLAILRPHDDQPVDSVAFLTASHRPDHIVLITAGPLNREMKIWAAIGEEGWLLPNDTETWQCIQTLELISSDEPRSEEAFFNQVVMLPQASLIILANAKKNAIYAVHVDYGPYPASTRMDYVADFTVTMPILSLTGTSDCLSDVEQVVQVYCVQTEAIQQYALDLCQCLPSEGFSVLEPSFGSTSSDLPRESPVKHPVPASSFDGAPSIKHPIFGAAASTAANVETKLVAPQGSSVDIHSTRAASSAILLNADFTGRQRSIDNHEVNQSVHDYSVDKKVDAIITNSADVSSMDVISQNEKNRGMTNDIPIVPDVVKQGGRKTHLITPSEILSGVIPSTESTPVTQSMISEDLKVQDVTVNNDAVSVEVEFKVAGITSSNCHNDFEPHVVHTEKGKSFISPAFEHISELENGALMEETSSMEKTRLDNTAIKELNQPPNSGAEVQDTTNNMLEKVYESDSEETNSQTSAEKGDKSTTKQLKSSGPSSSSSSAFGSTDSFNEPQSSTREFPSTTSNPLADAAASQILGMQEMLKQLMTVQKEMQKEMSALVGVPVTKEGRRLETALGRNMEKAVKANVDALWARIQEENAKREKIGKDHMRQLTSLITNFTIKDLPGMLERAIKKEVAAVGQAVAWAISPVIEKSISSAVADSFQKGVGDKAVNQLEKIVNSKLEALLARQIQAQFQTTGNHALQDALRSSFESLLIPAFEQSCRAMFEQIDATFQKGLTERSAAAQQQFESAYTPLSLTLREAINSASSIAQKLASELADGQRKLLTLVRSGNTKALNPLVPQQSNCQFGGLSEIVEVPMDPTKELMRLISERKFEEAFTIALQRCDVSLVSWLCSQVDIHGLCSIIPAPLSQGVLLALLQQLSCDIRSETPRKLAWITDVAVAINPADPMISSHVRPIFEHVYNILLHQRSLPTATAAEATSIRLITHVINSVLMSCK